MWSRYKLEVKDSVIPNIGKGVFTLEDIKKGEIITDYLGKVVDKTKIEMNKFESDRSIASPSSEELLNALKDDKDFTLIGDPEISYGPIINDCVVFKKYDLKDYQKIFKNGWMFLKHNIDGKDLDHNVMYDEHFDEKNKKFIIGIRAIRDIKAGEELFASYGYLYWFSRMYKEGWFD